jgi:hypothetical protein
MATVQQRDRQAEPRGIAADSAVDVLRSIEEERGKLFTEAECQEMRQTVLDEVAYGARCRPFTLITFGTVALGLLTLLVIGLVLSPRQTLGDFTLALVSGASLLVVAGFIWNYLRSIRLDAFRSIDERLEELEQLRRANLVSADEYISIHAHILISRQRGAASGRIGAGESELS